MVSGQFGNERKSAPDTILAELLWRLLLGKTAFWVTSAALVIVTLWLSADRDDGRW